MSSKNLYLNTKPSTLFWKAAVPGGISMLSSSLYTVFDAIFIGKFIGTTAFAALGLAMPLIVINHALAELVGVGSSVPISIFLGRREDQKANNYFTCSILLIMMTGFISGSLVYFSAPWFMQLMGAKGELLKLSIQYARVYAMFSPVSPLIFAVDNYLRISGKVKTSMILNIFMSCLTVVLELLLIIIIPMGVIGASLGSCFSMVICGMIAISFFVPGKLQLKFVKPKFSKGMLTQIYKNGAAPFLTNISGRLFYIVMNALLLRFGGAAGVAVYGVIMTLVGIIEQLMYGVVDSLQPALGYNYGARQIGRVKRIQKYALLAAATISVVGAVILFLFPGQLSVPFLEDLKILDLAIFAVRISSTAYLFRWFTVATQGFFMALEKPVFAMLVAGASACLFPLALVPILIPLELTGLWLNYPFAAMLTAVLAFIAVLKTKKELF